jgi:hypothetical protein
MTRNGRVVCLGSLVRDELLVAPSIRQELTKFVGALGRKSTGGEGTGGAATESESQDATMCSNGASNSFKGYNGDSKS